MLITLRFKTPDVIENALEHADFHPATSDDKIEEIKAEARTQLEKVIEYGEYLTVYYNTHARKLQLKGE